MEDLSYLWRVMITGSYTVKNKAPSVNNGWDSPWSMIGHQYPTPSNVRPTISRTTDGTLESSWTYPGSIAYTTQASPDCPFLNGNYNNPTSDIMVVP